MIYQEGFYNHQTSTLKTQSFSTSELTLLTHLLACSPIVQKGIAVAITSGMIFIKCATL